MNADLVCCLEKNTGNEGHCSMSEFESNGIVPAGVTMAAVLLSKQQSTFCEKPYYSFVPAEIERRNKSSFTAFVQKARAEQQE